VAHFPFHSMTVEIAFTHFWSSQFWVKKSCIIIEINKLNSEITIFYTFYYVNYSYFYPFLVKPDLGKLFNQQAGSSRQRTASSRQRGEMKCETRETSETCKKKTNRLFPRHLVSPDLPARCRAPHALCYMLCPTDYWLL